MKKSNDRMQPYIFLAIRRIKGYDSRDMLLRANAKTH